MTAIRKCPPAMVISQKLMMMLFSCFGAWSKANSSAVAESRTSPASSTTYGTSCQTMLNVSQLVPYVVLEAGEVQLPDDAQRFAPIHPRLHQPANEKRRRAQD